MSRVFKIVLTGGPCGGKTSSLEKIKSHFKNQIKIISIPELATVTIESGMTIVPEQFTAETHQQLTEAMIKMQLNTEKYFETLSILSKQDVIIVCDRGTCDNFAYCSEENKIKILKENDWNMTYLSYSRYDMVLHIMSASLGVQNFYGSETNKSRYEQADQAQILDQKTLNCWIDHPCV